MAFPTPTNITGLGSLGSYIVSVDGNFFNFMLIAIWFVIFVGVKSTRSSSVGVPFMAASLATFVLSVLLNIATLINTTYMITLLIMAGLGIIWTLNEPLG